jgi:hypothetical protein
VAYTSEQRGPYDFWSRVNKDGPTVRPELGPCWLWLGRPDRGGYGRLTSRGILAHRYAWEQQNGPIPTGSHHGTTCVLHRCDNPICVRPEHLFLGTHADNMLDMYAKKRDGDGRRGLNNGVHRYPDRYPRGEARPEAKLTEAQVRAMRAEHEAGATSIGLGQRYGVSQAQAYRVVKRQSWRHVV